MKTTIKNDTAVTLYLMLASAKISRYDVPLRRAIVRLTRSLRRFAEEYDKLRAEATERLKPVIVNEMTKESLRAEVNGVMESWLGETQEVELQPLPEEAIDALCESNDFTTAQIIILEDTFKDCKD